MRTGLQSILFIGFLSILVSLELSATTFYSQGDDDFSALANWNDAAGGGGANPVLVDLTSGTHDFVIQDGHTVTLDTNASVLSLLVGSPGAVAANLVFGDDISGDTLSVGALTVATNAVVSLSANNATHLIIATGAITNNGTLNLRNSFAQICNLQLNGTFAISGTPVQTKLGSFEMIAGTVTTNIPLDIDGNVVLTGGTWVGGGLRHEVAGNWLFTSGNYSYAANDTIDFNTSIVTIIDGGTEYFQNVRMNGGGVISLSNSIVTVGDWYIQNNTQVSSGVNVYARGSNFITEAGTEYNQTGGWFYFDGSTDIDIDLSGNVSINRVIFNNGIKNLTGNLITGEVRIESSATVNGNGDHRITNFKVDGVCNWSGTITFTGGTQYTNNAGGRFQVGTSDLIFNGACNIQTNDTLVAAGDVDVIGNYLIFNQNSHMEPLAAGTQDFTQAGGTRLYLRGDSVFPSTDFNLDLASNSFQRYDRNFTQYAVGGVTYGHIETYGVDDSLIFQGPTTIAGYLNPYGGSDHVVDLGPYEHHIKGSIYNSATANRDKKILSTGTVYLDGRGNQVLYDAATATGGGYYFNNLILDDDSVVNRYVYFREDTVRIAGDFKIQNTGSTGGDYLRLYIESSNRYFMNDGDAGDSLIIRNYALLYDRSDSCFKHSGESFGEWYLEDSSLVQFYNYNGDQWIPGGQYGNVYCYSNTNGEDKFVTGVMDINGYLQGAGSMDFDDGGFTHTIAGDWKMDDRHTDEGTLTGKFIFDGNNQTIVDNARWNLVDFANSGTVSASNWVRADSTMTIKNGATFAADNYVYLTNGHFVIEPTGDFTHTGGWLRFDGTQNSQNLDVQNPNASILNLMNYKYGVGTDTLKILGNLTVQNTVYLGYTNNGAPHRWNVTELTNGDTLSFGGDMWQPNVSSNGTSRILFNGGALHLNGTGNIQYIYQYNTANTYNDILFSGSAEKQLWSPGYNWIYDIDGDFTINSSVVSGGNRHIYIAGDFTNNGGSWIDSRTTNFDGLNQNIGASNFRTVWFLADTVSTAPTYNKAFSFKNITGDLSIDGHVYIDTNAFVNAGASGVTIEVLDDWYNNRSGSFLPGNSTTIFTGNVWSEIYNGGSGLGHEFYNFTVNKSPNTIRVRLWDTLDINGSLTIDNGYLRTRDNQIYVAENLTNNDVIEYNIAGTRITMDGTTPGATYNFNGNGSYFRDIVFKADPTITYQMGSDLNLYSNYDLYLDSGILDLNSKTLTMLGANGDLTITEGGTLEIDSAAALKMDNNSDLTNNGGALKIVGDSLDPGVLTVSTTGNFGVTQTGASSTLFLKNYKIENTNGNGIDVQAGAIDVATGLDNGSFSNGIGTAYLTVANTVDLSAFILDTVKNTHFNAGPTYNVQRTAGLGEFNFLNSIGTLSGESYDNDDADPGTLIKWHYDGIAYWDGNTDADGDNVNWNDPLNWVADAVPTNSDIVILDHSAVVGAYNVNLNTTVGECQTLVFSGGGTSITLTMNGTNLEVTGDMTIGVGDIVDMTTSATDTIKVGGNWTNSGTFNEGTAAVMLNGTNGTSTIQTGGAADPFYHLHISPNSTKIYALGSPIGIDGTFTLDSGIFNVVAASNIIYASGDWSVSGFATMDPSTGTVDFDGTNQQIDGGTFYNFTTSNSGTKTLVASLNTEDNGILTIGAGTVLDAQTNNLFVKGDWRNNVGPAGFLQSAPGAVFFNGAHQNIGYSTGNTTDFNDVYIQGTNYKDIYGTMTINGNFYHTSQSMYIRPNYYINGTGSGSLTQSGGAILAMGVESGPDSTNFPDGFGTYNLNAGSVYYYGDGDQKVDPITYYRLYLYTASGAVLGDRDLSGDITIAENLYVNDTDVKVRVNDHTININGSWNHTTGAKQFDWGTDGTLNSYGSGTFWFDRDIDTVNNVIFSGSGNCGNYYDTLAIGGNLDIQAGNNYYLRYPVRNFNAGKTFNIGSASTIRSYVGQPDTAFFTGFATYAIDPSAITYLYSGLSNSKINIYDVPNYGLLYLGNADTALLLGDLDVESNFWMNNNSIFVDNNNNMNIGGNVDVRTYFPGTVIENSIID